MICLRMFAATAVSWKLLILRCLGSETGCLKQEDMEICNSQQNLRRTELEFDHRLLSKSVSFKRLVAKRALRIQFFGKCYELRKAFVS